MKVVIDKNALLDPLHNSLFNNLTLMVFNLSKKQHLPSSTLLPYVHCNKVIRFLSLADIFLLRFIESDKVFLHNFN